MNAAARFLSIGVCMPFYSFQNSKQVKASKVVSKIPARENVCAVCG